MGGEKNNREYGVRSGEWKPFKCIRGGFRGQFGEDVAYFVLMDVGEA